jgi:hypothetical protein
VRSRRTAGYYEAEMNQGSPTLDRHSDDPTRPASRARSGSAKPICTDCRCRSFLPGCRI